jgi:hypothetical protein
MPTKPHSFAIAICAAVGLAFGAPAATGLPATLESKAKVAFADIAKAKAALNTGNTKRSQSLLAKSEGLLKTVLDRAPATESSSSNPAAAQQSTSPVSEAESEAAKLDPSLAAKLGARSENAPSANADAGTQTPAAASNRPNLTSTISELESAYQKVTLARTLLKAGNSSKAKSILDEIPSSPVGLLKSASGL